MPSIRLAKAERMLFGRGLVGAALQIAKEWAASGCKDRDAAVKSCTRIALGTAAMLAAEQGIKL